MSLMIKHAQLRNLDIHKGTFFDALCIFSFLGGGARGGTLLGSHNLERTLENLGRYVWLSLLNIFFDFLVRH